MTNAPVKDVSSLMNYVGSSRVMTKSGMDQTGSFGDVMSRASGGSAESVAQTQSAKDQTTKTDSSVEHSKAMKKDSSVVKTKESKPAEVSKTDKQAVAEAEEEAVKAVAEELGVSEEEVVAAMEEMGISLNALFDPSVLTQLVLKLAGGQDPMALLTDEGLFAKLQNLTEMVGTIQNDLMQELGVNPEELQMLLNELEAKGNADAVNMQTVVSETEEVQNAAEESAPEVVVEIEVNGETVKVSADESGNAVKTLTVTGDGQQAAQEETGSQHSDTKGQQEGTFQTGNPVLDSLLQNKVQTAEVAFEQTTFFSQNTQEIMDQIMDYMRIQLKPGMDQLQMQLHPASLGTVQVQLTSKGGEITAQFQVQNETVKAAIENQIVELKESLREQGVKVEAVEVTVQSNGFESGLWQGRGQEENAGSQGNKRSPRRIDLTNLDALFEEEAAPEDVLAAKMMEANGNTVDYTA
ncbi:MAG: flagellar hook-length control protein FliK [Lachnospiraceae bacterium]|nr:flagellar hook-length control protein FliK [Lachnospiraceae bacterium]